MITTTLLVASMIGGRFGEVAYIEFLPGSCQPLSVSDDGNVIVGGLGEADIKGKAFVWTRESGVRSIGAGVPRAVSKDGSEIVGVFGESARSFLISNGQRSEIEMPEGATQLFVHGVDKGSIYGYVDKGKGLMYPVLFDRKKNSWRNLGDESGIVWGGGENGNFAFGRIGNNAAIYQANKSRWEVVLQPKENCQSMVNAISGDGTTAVGGVQGRSGTPSQAFIYKNKTTTLLPDFPGGDNYSIATDVTRDGRIVVGQGTRVSRQTRTTGGDTAFVWTAETGLVDLNEMLVSQYGLNLQGVRLASVQDVTGDGRVMVGYGKTKINSKPVGFRLEFYQR